MISSFNIEWLSLHINNGLIKPFNDFRHFIEIERVDGVCWFVVVVVSVQCSVSDHDRLVAETPEALVI